jgi:hypothetical protein
VLRLRLLLLLLLSSKTVCPSWLLLAALLRHLLRRRRRQVLRLRLWLRQLSKLRLLRCVITATIPIMRRSSRSSRLAPIRAPCACSCKLLVWTRRLSTAAMTP